jgi:hypothetical protein
LNIIIKMVLQDSLGLKFDTKVSHNTSDGFRVSGFRCQWAEGNGQRAWGRGAEGRGHGAEGGGHGAWRRARIGGGPDDPSSLSELRRDKQMSEIDRCKLTPIF